MHNMSRSKPSRRDFLRIAAMTGAALALPDAELRASAGEPQIVRQPLQQFGYGAVALQSEIHQAQLRNTHSVLMNLSEDGLLKPFRQMAGMPAPGEDLGGWYMYKADYDYQKDSAGLAPGGTFGQWISALSRMYAITGDPATRAKVLRLNRLFAQSIASGFFEKNRFPAYCYDKLVCGLIDSHQFANDPNAFDTLQLTTRIALPHLPEHAVDREQNWRPGKDVSYSWDESYTLPENLFLACQRGAGKQYRDLAIRYLDDQTYFDPLSQGKNVLGGKHAYSYVNALSSAMQAYFTLDSAKHLQAAKNGFDMLRAQSFATGGWGPDELLQGPGSEALAASLTKTHSSFETPCGSYAHFKLTRYLLQTTRDSRYGDSMEQVMYNSVLGAMPLMPDGEAFYYSDYNFDGQKSYSRHRWPCCSGTLPQVAADYYINAYFRDEHGVYVNLYIPSTLKWSQGGSQRVLTQTGQYPAEDAVHFEVQLAKPSPFALHLRIPSWAEKASISLNGKRQPIAVVPATFATIEREWKSGDRVDLEIPMTTRLQAIDQQHPNTVAVRRGPLVLFPVAAARPVVTGQQLLAAREAAPQDWLVETANGPIHLLPFTAIGEQRYATYVQCT